MTNYKPPVEIGSLTVQSQVDHDGDLELSHEVTEYSNFGGSVFREVFVFLTRDQQVALRDHLNGLIND